MRFIDSVTIAKIKSFKNKILNRRFSSVLEGAHLSNFACSQSQEFSEYKQYARGNDTRFIDWKVYAKKDRLFIKRYLQEKALKHNFIVDASGSMAFKSARSPVSKWEFAAGLFMAFACHTLIKSDPGSLFCVSQTHDEKTGFSNHLNQLANFDKILSQIKPSGATLPSEKLQTYLRGCDNNSEIVLFSDLMIDYPEIEKIIKLLSGKRIKATVFHILDRGERDFLWRGRITVRDSETLKEINLTGENIQLEYKREFEKWTRYCRKSFSSKKIPYFCCYSDTPLEKAVEKYILS